MTFPLVSIVTPVYNGLPYIEECVRSTVTQSYERIEHVLVDGCSTDGTLELLSRYEREYPKKLRLVSEPDDGPAQAWQKGAQLARGEILGCLGADDLLERDAVKAVVEFFLGTPQACFVHGHCDRIDEKGQSITQQRAEPFKFQEFVNTALNICTPSAFYRRCVMERIGWLGSGDDFEVMIRIMQHFDVHRLDRVLSKVRVRSGSYYNPADFSVVKALQRQTYTVSRKYGGDLWSPISVKHHLILLINALGLGFLWPSVMKVGRSVKRRIRRMSRAA